MADNDLMYHIQMKKAMLDGMSFYLATPVAAK